MNINTKEQIIWLLLNDVSYKDQWHYLKLLSQLNLINNHSSLKDLQSLVNQYKFKAPYTFLRHINFYRVTDQYKHIGALAQQAIIVGEPLYPKLWLQIPQPPIIVFYTGNLDILNRPLISIVGTRKVTSYGQEIASQLVNQINREGWVCVSGLARGVDRVVHETANMGYSKSTIAIIPTGTNQYYPLQNALLQQELAERQLILSEYLPDSRAKKFHFIMRNRLVAGISPVTIIIEAAKNSGSLITANYALQFNREVIALPGRITDTQSQGCNELIQIGATPLLSIDIAIQEIKELLTAQGIISLPNKEKIN